ncbi:MAG: hypothetical protein KGI50_05550 [Patescibacteria group bacterium]|nr:hypothetical protein [Patescibacteria group bacterium]MDE2438902.1 hypothetical protein [Patescibacteria group bacterium]
MKVRRSKVAEWCRCMDCYLNGKLAVISGWEHDFATVASLDGVLTGQWTWEAVSRIMRTGRNFTLS